jgi:hypothetical protein
MRRRGRCVTGFRTIVWCGRSLRRRAGNHDSNRSRPPHTTTGHQPAQPAQAGVEQALWNSGHHHGRFLVPQKTQQPATQWTSARACSHATFDVRGRRSGEAAKGTHRRSLWAVPSDGIVSPSRTLFPRLQGQTSVSSSANALGQE